MFNNIKVKEYSRKIEIPVDIKESLGNLDQRTTAKIKMLYNYGLQNISNVTPSNEFEYILRIFSEAIIKNYNSHKVWQLINIPGYLNLDWEYIFVKERNLVDLAATILLLKDGNYVVGSSHADCCSYCKETIHGKLFRVMTEPVKLGEFRNSISPSMVWEITATEMHNEVPCRCTFNHFLRKSSWVDKNGKVQFVVNDSDENTRQQWELKQTQEGNLQ